MPRRASFIAMMTRSATALAASFLLLAASAAFTKPNVVVLVADDAGWSDFGAYGHPTIRTPAIDRLAREGWTAEHAFLTTAQCSPSRISILTGLYPHETGAEDLHVPLPEDQVLLPSMLAAQGYFSGILRKRHLGPNGDAQFDWMGDDVESFLAEAGGRPFFLWVGFTDPHRPYPDAPPVHGPADVRLPPVLRDTPATRRDYARYYDEIARMDGEIGGFVDLLERRGLRGSTYVLFFSDNGPPMPRAKATLYDAGIRTPLIVTGPGIPAGVRYEPLVSLIDLAPTILDWAGAPAPSNLRGESLAAALANPAVPGRSFVFGERNWHNADEHMRSLRDERYKLIWNNYVTLPHGTPADIAAAAPWQDLRRARDAGELEASQALLFAVPRPRVELYDLESDPHELDNLAGRLEYRDRVQAMMAELERWIEVTGDHPPQERRRDDNVDRYSGIKFMTRKPPLIE